MIDLKRLHNEIIDVVASGLHQIENLEKINSLKSAAEVTAAVEGGIKRYVSDRIYRAKVQMLVAHIMDKVSNAAVSEGEKNGSR